METDRVLGSSSVDISEKVKAGILHLLNVLEHASGIQQQLMERTLAGEVPSAAVVAAHARAAQELSAAIATVRLVVTDPPSATLQ